MNYTEREKDYEIRGKRKREIRNKKNEEWKTKTNELLERPGTLRNGRRNEKGIIGQGEDSKQDKQ